MIRQIFNIVPSDMATEYSQDNYCLNLSSINVTSFERERWLNWFELVAHSSGAFSQHVIYTLIEGADEGGKMT